MELEWQRRRPLPPSPPLRTRIYSEKALTRFSSSLSVRCLPLEIQFFKKLGPIRWINPIVKRLKERIRIFVCFFFTLLLSESHFSKQSRCEEETGGEKRTAALGQLETGTETHGPCPAK